MILNNALAPLDSQCADLWPMFITLILAVFYWGTRKIMKKKKISPIVLIVVSAVLGVAVYGI